MLPGKSNDKQAVTGKGGDVFQRPAKRVKHTTADQAAGLSRRRERTSSASTIGSSITQFRQNDETTEQSVSAGRSPSIPLTPSTISDDYSQAELALLPGASPSLPRFSLNALLAGSPGRSQPFEGSASPSTSARLPPLHQTYYGLDRGFVDRDIGRNDDQNAISGHSPPLQRDALDTPSELGEQDLYPEFGFGMQQNSPSNEANNYYSGPVPIYISRDLEPLPQRYTFAP